LENICQLNSQEGGAGSAAQGSSKHEQDVQPLQVTFVYSPVLREIPSKVTPSLQKQMENI
jgi:hypothetical protein